MQNEVVKPEIHYVFCIFLTFSGFLGQTAVQEMRSFCHFTAFSGSLKPKPSKKFVFWTPWAPWALWDPWPSWAL